jgi:hypothetical protein
MTKKGKALGSIPTFASYEEEAKFWDTHDFGDFWEETEPAEVVFDTELSADFTVRLSPTTLELLRKHAAEKGVTPSILARRWLIERLREAETSTAR